MLAQSEMIVVFVLDESISLGKKLTAVLRSKAIKLRKKTLKVPQRRAGMETYQVERVNPTSEKPKFGRGISQNEMKGWLEGENLR